MSEPPEPPCPEKPRRSTQFKPGQSGNPLGRPKRKLDMSVALNKALNAKIRVSNLGKTRTGMEAVVQSIPRSARRLQRNRCAYEFVQ